MTAPLVLLPPSEGKAGGGSGAPWDDARHGARRTDVLDGARRTVLAALADAMRGPAPARQKLLGVGATATDAATATNLAAATAPTRPAIERYDGVLYGALDHASLSRRDRTRLCAQVLVFSGLWGAVAPDDPIPDYKCKMGASLPQLGKLATWWRPNLAPLLAARASRRVVWNLLPNEHDAACVLPDDATLVVRVRFLDDVARRNGRELVVVNHWNKLLKGSLVRHVLATQLRDPDGLAAFSHPEGYAYRPDLTVARGREVTVSMVAVR